MSRSSGLPDGYVERAVAEILAATDRGGPSAGAPANSRSSGGAASPGAAVPFRACPGCGAPLSDPSSFVQEYWVGRETRFMVWCRGCHGTYTVVPVERYESHEAID